MPGPIFSSAKPQNGANGHAIESEPAAQAAPYSPEQFRRTVELVADGELPLPEHLPAEQRASMAREVQELRRRRLVQFTARVIARDILDARRPKQGG